MSPSVLASWVVRRTFVHIAEPCPLEEKGDAEMCRSRTRSKSDFDSDYSCLVSVASGSTRLGSGGSVCDLSEVACKALSGSPFRPRALDVVSDATTEDADDVSSSPSWCSPFSTPRAVGCETVPALQAEAPVPVVAPVPSMPGITCEAPQCQLMVQAASHGTPADMVYMAVPMAASAFGHGVLPWGTVPEDAWSFMLAGQEHQSACDMGYSAAQTEAALQGTQYGVRGACQAETVRRSRAPWHSEAEAGGDAAPTDAMGRAHDEMRHTISAPADLQADSMRTTVMLRNLPNDFSREMLLELLDKKGFAGSYDFVYYPFDFQRGAGFGYAFLNLVDAAAALRVRQALQGFSSWQLPSRKVLDVCWGNPLQGLAACVERYRNSPVMHEAVPDEFRPAIFSKGTRLPFPPPTKKIRNPRWKRGSAESSWDHGRQTAASFP